MEEVPSSTRQRFVLPIIALLVGAGLMWLTMVLVFPRVPSTAPIASSTGIAAPSAKTWTCSMHPQIRKDKPGTCPICGMPLIPVNAAKLAGAGDAAMLVLGEHARAMAQVETVPVAMRELSREIRAVGKIQYNETASSAVTSRVDGYVERLYVDATGVRVRKGDHLVEIYSPDLIVAQSDMLIGGKLSDRSRISEGSRIKLRRWGITEPQIEAVATSGKIQEELTLFSPVEGTVVEKMVVLGSFVEKGTVLYRLANLDSVWLLLDIYEYEIGWMQYGQTVEATGEAFPGKTFRGLVTFISPTVNEETRAIRVRVTLQNTDGQLKPGMFVHAMVRVGLHAGGVPAPTGMEGKFICPMHPEVVRDVAGKCPICEMPLEKLPGKPVPADDAHKKVLAVPATAVLDSGLRTLVYVEKARGEFKAAEVKLGPRSGEFFPILSGLKEGDQVAVRGNFLLDSQFQVQGLPSLFDAPAAVHDHGGAAPAAPKQDKPAAPPTEHKH